MNVDSLLKEYEIKSAQDARPNLYIKNSLILDGTGKPPKSSYSIFIEEGLISCLGSHADARALEIPHKCLDAEGFTLLPGLIDAHVHLVFDGKPVSHSTSNTMKKLELKTENEVLLSAAAMAQQTLVSGITTVRDCGDRNNCTLTLRDSIASGMIRGPLIVACGMAITTTAGHGYHNGLLADSVDEVRKAVRSQVQSGADFVKFILTGGMMTPGTNISRSQYSFEETLTAVEEAHRLGKRLAAHVHSADGMAMGSKAGIDTMEHCNWFSSEGTSYDPAVVDEMARSNLFASFTFHGWDYPLLLPKEEYSEEQKKFRMVREERYAMIRDMISTGVPYLINTDAGCPNTPHGSLVRAAQVFVELVGMDPLQTITAITKSPAEALGLEDKLGTIAVGKQADLIMVQGDPIKDIITLQNAPIVIQNGKIIAINGHLVI